MKRLLLIVLLSILLALPTFATCVGDITDVNSLKSVQKYSASTKIDQIDTIKFGRYYIDDAETLEPIEWIKLADNGEDTVLMSKYVLEYRKYNEEKVDITWENCSLRYWLNNTFFNTAFYDSEKPIINNSSLKNNDNDEYGTLGGNDTKDRVFLLNDVNFYDIFDHAKSSLSSDNIKEWRSIAYPTNYAMEQFSDYTYDDISGGTEYWLRSVGKHQNRAQEGDGAGSIYSNAVVSAKKGVRPVIFVNNNRAINYIVNENYVIENNFYNNNENVESDEEDINDEVEEANALLYASKMENGNILEDVDSTIPVVKNGWEGDYYYENGTKVVNRWVPYGSDYYYCGSSGAIEKNKWIGDYYVDSTGKMLKNTTTPDGYQVDANGKYVENKKETTKSIKETTKNIKETTKSTKENKSTAVNDSAKEKTLSNASEEEKRINDNINALIKENNKKDNLSEDIYYYAKQESKNEKIYTSISKKTIKDGLFGTGFFSRTDNTYYNIEIKLNNETTKRLSKYAEFCAVDKTFMNAFEWMMLAGYTMNDLENIGGFGISPFCDDEWPAETEGLSYYQKGVIQISCKNEDNQKEIYNKLTNANVLLIATNNIIESYEEKYKNNIQLGSFIRFEAQEPVGGLNWVRGHVDCEKSIIEYTKNHKGYYIYAIDRNYNNRIYDKLIEKPWESCPYIDIFIAGTDSLEYAMYGNRMNYLTNNTSAAVNKIDIYGGKIIQEYKIVKNKNYKDFETFYNAKK